MEPTCLFPSTRLSSSDSPRTWRRTSGWARGGCRPPPWGFSAPPGLSCSERGSSRSHGVGGGAGRTPGMRGPDVRKRWPWMAALALLNVIAVIRIVSASSNCYQTSDEGIHIACGVLWMKGGHDFFCLDQPPLARVAAAVPLILDGALSDLPPDFRTAADVMPVFRKHYERSLRLARIGVLPFFLVASWMVWVWTRRFFGEAPALAAVFLFQGLPLVLAHSGLATMDVPAAALLAVVLYLE